jgi:hypothetical protein
MSVSSAASSMSVSSGERSDLHSVSSRPPRYHSQSRAGLWRNKKKRFLAKAQPTHKELFWASRSGGQNERTRSCLPSISTRRVAEQDLDEQEEYLEEMLAAQDRDSYGLPPPPKTHDTLRIILNNVNGLQLFARGKEKEKIGRIETTRKKYQSDIYCCVENWVQWDMATSDQQFDDIFGIGEERYCSVAFNRQDRLSGSDGRSQPGGTSILATGRTSDFASKKGMDDDSLGQWCHIRLGTETHATWLMCAYNPPSSSRYVRRNRRHQSYTVYSQRQRYLRGKGCFTDPCKYFIQKLVEQLLVWKQNGDNIILVGDFNEDVYQDGLAARLQEEDLQMSCQFQRINGERLPNSHQSGRTPLMTMFATEGIQCTNAYAAAHGAHVGDHRLLIYDFHAPSILGTHLPHMPRPQGRGVRSKVPRLRKTYNKRLNELNERNNMRQRLDDIANSTVLTNNEKLVLLNRWDVQETEHQRCAERKCNRGGNRNVEFCEEVSIVLRKIRCLDRVIKFKQGKVPDGRNLFKLCRAIEVPEPRDITIAEAKNELCACKELLETLRDEAPMLRNRMLQKRLVAAKRRGDGESAEEIKRILKKEARQKKFKTLKLKMGKPRSAPLCEVIVPDDEFPEFSPRYTARGDVEAETGLCIRERYQLGHRSILASEPFLSEIGHLGDGPAVQQILQGTYEFPNDTPPEVEALFREAASLYQQTQHLGFNPYIEEEEYQYWWKHCRIDTQSSYSNIHYDHYVCAAYDKDLTSLQVAKLNTAIRLGWPLQRWLHTVIVLLQKEMGTVFINKLRAICLFEADFNYVLKVIFAQRMMGNLNREKLLPLEQHAKAFSGAKNATMNRLLYQDIHRTLHWPYAVASVDLGDCYDALYHGWSAISLLAAGVPNAQVKMMLVALQCMGWHLRTGFGLSASPFRGSDDKPMMGMGQGSSAAAPSFSVTSLLQTNAYRRMGHCQPIYSSWTGLLLMLAAVIYVDDTDLLVRSKRRRLSDEEFFSQIQAAITCWGLIIMATGGHCKQAKCKVSIVSFEYKNGRSSIRPQRDLPQTAFVIPQHDGPSLPIDHIPPDQACEALGTFVAADGNQRTQLDEMKKKGLSWADQLSLAHLPPADGFLSLNIHLKPRLCWNLVTVCESPKVVDKALSKVFFKALPYLRVNRNLRTEFRHLPVKYQGLGIFDVNVERLGLKLFWIQRHWGASSLEGQLLLHSYEAFSIDLGLDGNPFKYSFDRYSYLAESSSWWKDLWELLAHFGVRLELDKTITFQPFRLDDKSIMRWFIESNLFSKHQLVRLNRVRKRKCLFFLSELLLCDGQKVNVFLLDGSEGCSRTRTYPFEKPTGADVDLWRTAIRTLTSPTYYLPTRLGFLQRLDPNMDWFWNEQDNLLVRYNRNDDGNIRAYDQFTLSDGGTARRPQFTWHHSSLLRPNNITHAASVYIMDDHTVSLISHTYLPPPPISPSSIVEILQSWGNDSLWNDLQLDGDGSWLIEGIMHGTVEGAADGSFMKEVSPDVCSAAFMLKCNHSNQKVVGTWVEESPFAGNYRGEIFGGMALALLLRAASLLLPDNAEVISPVKLWFDNSGVIHHGNKPYSDLTENQSQADVLSLFKKYLRDIPFTISFEKVDSHVDDYRHFSTYTRQETWNIAMDKLAKEALVHSLETNSFITPPFPFEHLRAYTGFGKISGSPIAAIYDWYGYNSAKTLFESRDIVSSQHFDLIFWEGMGKAVKTFPPMFTCWIAKHVSHFCGTNRQLSKMDGSVKNICPSCGRPDESTSHITRCSDPGRLASLRAAVEDLSDWMEDNDTEPSLQHYIEEYLLGHGELDMFDVIDGNPEHIEFAEIHDTLGWDNFVEGRISKRLVHLQAQYLSTIHTFVQPSTWASGLMRQLLLLTHQQWLYRNCTVHYKADGRSLPQHKQILQKVTNLLNTDEDDLLPEDRNLLHLDFSQLAEGPAIDQERWIAGMESALVARRVHRARQCRRVRLPNLRIRRRSDNPASAASSLSSDDANVDGRSEDNDDEDDSSSSQDDSGSSREEPPPPPVLRSRQYITSYFPPIRDSEGSIRFRRRRRRT